MSRNCNQMQCATMATNTASVHSSPQTNTSNMVSTRSSGTRTSAAAEGDATPSVKKSAKKKTGDAPPAVVNMNSNSSIYIGRKITREFDGELYHGTVDSVRTGNKMMWHVTYNDDGDQEELNRRELLFALDLHERLGDIIDDDDDGDACRAPFYYAGRRISKKFGRKIYQGTIDNFDQDDNNICCGM